MYFAVANQEVGITLLFNLVTVNIVTDATANELSDPEAVEEAVIRIYILQNFPN